MANSISNSKPIHSETKLNQPKDNSYFFKGFLHGSIAGIAGRLSSNNIKQMIACFQAGRPKIDFSFVTAKGMIFGSTAQIAVMYGLRASLDLEHSNENQLLKGIKTLAASSCASMFAHPSTVGFYLSGNPQELKRLGIPNRQHSKNLTAELQQIYQIAKINPAILTRGLGIRVLAGGLDWASFFTLKQSQLLSDYCQNDALKINSLAAALSLGVSTPLYQLIMGKIRNDNLAIASKPIDSPATTIAPQAKLLAINPLHSTQSHSFKNDDMRWRSLLIKKEALLTRSRFILASFLLCSVNVVQRTIVSSVADALNTLENS